MGAVLATLLRQPAKCLPSPEAIAPLEAEAPPGEPCVSNARGQDDAADDLDDDQEDDIADDDERTCPNVPWEAVLDRLAQRIGQEAVDVWLRPSLPLSCEDGVLLVAVRTAQVVDWLENRYYKAICEVVHEVTGERLKLCFVAARRNFLPDGP